MISKQQQKYVQSLHNKKYRNEYGEFLVEGEKNFKELVHSDFQIQEVFCTETFANSNAESFSELKFTIAKAEQIAHISTQVNQTSVIAVVKKREPQLWKESQKVTLVLDDINDPGNLGTIIRIADWYGLNQVVCSENTVEFYNPKVIAATMGSFCRVNCFYTKLSEYLSDNSIPAYGAYLEGENVHNIKITSKIRLVIGSESHGINTNLSEYIRNKITIHGAGKAESLNAAVATGIILDNLLRIK